MNALKLFMMDHKMTAKEVAALVGRKPKTVHAWAIGARRIPDWALDILRDARPPTVWVTLDGYRMRVKFATGMVILNDAGDPAQWLELDATKALLEEFESVYGTRGIITREGRGGHTLAHMRLALDFVEWLKHFEIFEAQRQAREAVLAAKEGINSK